MKGIIDETEYTGFRECEAWKDNATTVIKDILSDIENTDFPLTYEEVSIALHKILEGDGK